MFSYLRTLHRPSSEVIGDNSHDISKESGVVNSMTKSSLGVGWGGWMDEKTLNHRRAMLKEKR